MRNVMKIGAVLVAAAMIFAGCGDPMVSLTEDEENIVVNYSAGTLAKHNGYQQEGMTALFPEEEEPSEEETEEPEEKEEPTEEEQREDDKESQEPEKQPEEKPSEEEVGQLTLTEAISLPDVEFSYHDYSTADSYKEGDASEGNVLLMLNVNMTNTGNKALECDLLAKQLKFTLSLNGEAGIPNQTTMLTNDMSTYKGTLDSGQTEAVILLFDVPQQTADNISSMQLSLLMNGKTTDILLK